MLIVVPWSIPGQRLALVLKSVKIATSPEAQVSREF